MQVGSFIQLKPGTYEHLKKRGWLGDFEGTELDGKVGIIVGDHREWPGSEHFGVRLLGTEESFGIPEECLEEI